MKNVKFMALRNATILPKEKGSRSRPFCAKFHPNYFFVDFVFP
jgi:hypothetical protein